MSDIIDRKAAIDALRYAENHAFNSFYQCLIKAHKIIAELPTARPERKNGKWVRCDTDGLRDVCKCSECGAMIDIQEEFRSFFCYHCGADMRGKQDE